MTVTVNTYISLAYRIDITDIMTTVIISTMHKYSV